MKQLFYELRKVLMGTFIGISMATSNPYISIASAVTGGLFLLYTLYAKNPQSKTNV